MFEFIGLSIMLTTLFIGGGIGISKISKVCGKPAVAMLLLGFPFFITFVFAFLEETLTDLRTITSNEVQLAFGHSFSSYEWFAMFAYLVCFILFVVFTELHKRHK